MDEPCTLPLSNPKDDTFTFGVAFRFFVARNRRHFKCDVWFELSKSQPTDDKLSLKGACSLSRDLYLLENKR